MVAGKWELPISWWERERPCTGREGALGLGFIGQETIENGNSLPFNGGHFFRNYTDVYLSIRNKSE